MDRAGVDTLDGARTYWVPAVCAPRRDWPGMPGCRRGARFVIDEATCRPARDNFPLFDNRGACLEWIMAHSADLARNVPGAPVRPVSLAHWLLGLA